MNKRKNIANLCSFVSHKGTKKVQKILLSVLFLYGWSFGVSAQQYPVQVTTTIAPPYSLYPADYASPESSSLQVLINLLELDRTNLRVKLRVTIEGAGINLRTRPSYVPPAIVLQGGVPELLTGFDIRSYLNPDNLDFSGISKAQFIRSGRLPEGFYTFTVEVLEYNRSVLISNQSVANAWIVLNDPPILNMPFNGDKLIATNPQSITFSWTPRHTASPNAAFTTEYEFKLVEMYPGQNNPEVAIRSSNSIFKTTTRLTSLNYGIIEPTLIPGRKYAFRIRAYDTSGRDLFKNSGYSETYIFQYGDACVLPAEISAEALDPNRVRFQWEPAQVHSGFILTYRRTGSNDWFAMDTYSNSQIVPELSGQTTYEYRVQPKCGSVLGEPSPVYTISTPEVEESDFVCGADMPDFEMNPNPLQKPLLPFDVIRTGDWEVNLKEVTANGDGSYRGEGYAAVPLFSGANLRVTFDRIFVNEDYRVIGGNVRTVYSSDSRFVVELDREDRLEETEGGGETDGGDEGGEAGGESIDDGFPGGDIPVDTTMIAGEIIDIVENEDGTVTVTTDDGTEEVVTPDEDGDILVADGSGNTYIVDSEGHVSQGGVTGGSAPDPVGSDEEVDFIVQFAPNEIQSFGFDEKRYDALAGEYTQTEINDESYWVAWKSVASGRTDYVDATVSGGEDFPEYVGFKTATANVASQQGSSSDRRQVTIQGKFNGEVEELQAYVIQEDEEENEQEIIVGQLKVVSYDQERNKVIIVPVNAVSAPSAMAISNELNRIYGQAVAHWEVVVDNKFEVEPEMITGLDDGESGILASFPQKMRQFNKEYKNRRSIDKDAYYLFLVSGSGSSRSGFMPFKRQYGYIFTDNAPNLAKTIAHELGHGAFRLRHTFSNEAFVATQGATDNLMDYSQGTKLYKHQWDYVHNPESMIGWFEEDAESAYKPYEFLVGRNVVPGQFASHINSVSGGISFVTQTGGVITLPHDVKDITFGSNGLLVAFTVNEEGKLERYVSTQYTSNENFAGYRKDLHVDKEKPVDNMYQDKLSNSINHQFTKVYFGFFEDGSQLGGTCGINLYESNYKVEVSGNWNSGGNEKPKADISSIKGKLSINGGESENPVYQNKIKYLNKKILSPEACELCPAGRKFVDNYAGNITSDKEYQALFKTAKTLCNFPDQSILNAFAAESDQKFREKLEEWLLWGIDKVKRKAARESFWSRKDAWQIYFKQLNFFLDTYLTFKSEIASGTISNWNLKAIVNARTEEFLSLYSIEERIEIIRNLLPEDDKILTYGGQVNYAELLVVNGEENAVLKVLKSVITEDDAKKMLEGLSRDGYIEKLNFHLDDIGFGGNNFTALAIEFRRLMLLKNNLITNDQQKQYVFNNPNTYFLLWNDDNLFFPKKENGIISYNEISVKGSKLKVVYDLTTNCRVTQQGGEDNGMGGVTAEIRKCDYQPQPPIELDYFAPAVLTIAGDFRGQLPSEITSIGANGFLTYAGFLDYLNEKQGTAQAVQVIDYTLTAASLAFGVGELVVVIRAGATAGRIAVISWELGSEIVDLSLKTKAFEAWCVQNPTACNNIKTANLINQIGSISASGFDIIQNWDAIRAANDLTRISDDIPSTIRRFNIAEEFANGATRVERTINNNGRSIKLVWTKQSGGKIDFGNRNNLKIILGTVDEDEAHHIVVWTRGGENPVVQKAAEDGFHLNMFENGVGLQKYRKSLNEGLHGNHPEYDNYIVYRLNEFAESKQFKYTAQEANEFIQAELIPEMRTLIDNASQTDLNLNEYFKQIVNPALGID